MEGRVLVCDDGKVDFFAGALHGDSSPCWYIETLHTGIRYDIRVTVWEQLRESVLHLPGKAGFFAHPSPLRTVPSTAVAVDGLVCRCRLTTCSRLR